MKKLNSNSSYLGNSLFLKRQSRLNFLPLSMTKYNEVNLPLRKQKKSIMEW